MVVNVRATQSLHTHATQVLTRLHQRHRFTLVGSLERRDDARAGAPINANIYLSDFGADNCAEKAERIEQELFHGGSVGNIPLQSRWLVQPQNSTPTLLASPVFFHVTTTCSSPGSTEGGTMTIEEITARICAFRDARDWMQFHNPKEL